MSENLKPAVRQDCMATTHGHVVLTFPSAITAEDYDDIVAWLDLFQRRLGRFVTGNAPTASTNDPAIVEPPHAR